MTRAFASKAGKNNFYIVGEVAADSTWQGRRLGGMFIDTNNPNNVSALADIMMLCGFFEKRLNSKFSSLASLTFVSLVFLSSAFSLARSAW